VPTSRIPGALPPLRICLHQLVLSYTSGEKVTSPYSNPSRCCRLPSKLSLQRILTWTLNRTLCLIRKVSWIILYKRRRKVNGHYQSRPNGFDNHKKVKLQTSKLHALRETYILLKYYLVIGLWLIDVDLSCWSIDLNKRKVNVIYRLGHTSLDKNAFKSLTSVKRLMAHAV
jgi:hypothetical protein